MCKNAFFAIITAASVATVTSPARAGYQVTSTFDTVSPGEVVTLHSSLLPGGQESGWAGIYNFKNASGYLTGSYQSFCIDISQDIFSNQTATFDVNNLSSAPVPGAAMGTLKANLLSELWYKDRALVTNNSTAAAFQIAIWEIINETTTDGNGNLVLNISSGNFYVTASDGATLTTAQNWLKGIDITGNGSKANLVALTNSTYQDYVVEAVPVPSSLVLALLGAIMLLTLRAWHQRGTAIVTA
jgi:hypothetical protein